MGEFPYKQRVIRILELLSSGHAVSTEVLDREFRGQVSLRTLQRDLQEIAGILPLEQRMSRGRLQEWIMPPSYRRILIPTVGQNELLAFHMLKSFLRSLKGTRLTKDLDSLEDKLEALVPGDVLLMTERFDEELIHDQNRGYFDYTQYDETITRLVQAVTAKEWLEIEYFPVDRTKATMMTLYPHRLYTYNGSLYLLGTVYNYTQPISLLIQFIRSITIPSDPPGTIPDFSASEFRLSRFGVFNGELEKVKILIMPGIRRHIQGHHWHDSQDITENGDGTLNLEMKVPILPDFIAWVLSWGAGMKVLEPQSLIDRILEEQTRVKELYLSDGAPAVH